MRTWTGHPCPKKGLELKHTDQRGGLSSVPGDPESASPEAGWAELEGGAEG